MQAAILRVKLRHLDEWNAKRVRFADAYRDQLTDRGLTLPTVHENAETVWHLFVVRTGERERLQSLLKEEGIATGIHYPVPLHEQPAYEDRRASYSLPVTERAAREVLSLPMYPELSQEQIEAICSAVTAAFAGVSHVLTTIL
jgi:dTDP-4-amino-4,6-dideoxygalactose transaminase